MPFFRRVRGIRASMPTGTVIGRKSRGTGAPEMITPGELSRAASINAPVATPGAVTTGLPPGGTEGQVLTMVGGNPTWITPVDDDTPGAGGSGGGGGMLPLVNGDTPGPVAIADDVGQFIGVPL